MNNFLIISLSYHYIDKRIAKTVIVVMIRPELQTSLYKANDFVLWFKKSKKEWKILHTLVTLNFIDNTYYMSLRNILYMLVKIKKIIRYYTLIIFKLILYNNFKKWL